MKFDYPAKLEHIMSYTATLSAPEVIGPVAAGLRLNFYVTGGEVSGPAINGTLKPAGADWFTVRSDGVGILDVKGTIETDNDALIYFEYAGMAELGPDGYDNMLNGVPLPETGLEIRSRPVFQTSHPDFLWLNRAFCIGVGKAFGSEVKYDVYQLPWNA